MVRLILWPPQLRPSWMICLIYACVFDTFWCFRNGWRGLWAEENWVSGWNVYPGETVHWSQRPVRLSLIYMMFLLNFDRHKMSQIAMSNIHIYSCVWRLYRERLCQVKSKLAEVEAGRAAEYLEPLAVLLENMQVRTKVAGTFNTQTNS